jgi:NAD(P)-dependent dehydrogenase (short-subunit alcohol dehydrogenase family)
MTDGMFSLKGQAALVTGAGANGGIGHAIALGYARAGARLAVCDIDSDGLARTAEELSALNALAGAELCDISRPAEVEALFAAVDRTMGRIDILVNVPFAFPRRTAPHEVALEDWERMFAVNVTGYFLCIRAAVKRMLTQGGGGAIINIGSNAGETALGRGAFPYSCTKAAVHQMTKELAVEYGAHGIRTNAILPAQVLTPGLQAHFQDPRFKDKVLPRILMGLPMGRLLSPEDMVGPAIFLASKAAEAVNGVLLPVDGGNLAMNAGGSHAASDPL